METRKGPFLWSAASILTRRVFLFLTNYTFFSSKKFLTLHTLFLEKVCFFTPKSCTSVEMKCVPTTRRTSLSVPWSVGCAADKKSLLSRRKLAFPTKHELNRKVDDEDAAKYFPPKEKGGNTLPELTLSKDLIGSSGPASYVDYFIISLEVVGRDKVVGRAKAYLQERQCWSVILRKIHKNLYAYVFCYQKRKLYQKVQDWSQAVYKFIIDKCVFLDHVGDPSKPRRLQTPQQDDRPGWTSTCYLLLFKR